MRDDAFEWLAAAFWTRLAGSGRGGPLFRGVPLLIGSISFLLSGCFHYRSAELSEVGAGAQIVAHLARPTDFQSGGMRMTGVTTVEGSVVRVEGSRTLLVVEAVHLAGGARHRVTHTPFWIGPGDLRGLEERQFDRRNSLWAGSGLVLVGAMVAGTLFRGNGTDGGGLPPPTDPVAHSSRSALRAVLGSLLR